MPPLSTGPRKSSVSRCLFCVAHSPFTRLYDAMTPDDAAVLDHHLEVAPVNLAQRLLVHDRVRVETVVLDVVGGVVLGGSGDVLLHADHVGGSQASEVEAVLAVGLLGAPPERMAQDVHAGGQDHRVARRDHLVADRLRDLVLEVDVEGGATGHADREGRRERVAHPFDGEVDAARSVAEPELADPARVGVVGDRLVVRRSLDVGVLVDVRTAQVIRQLFVAGHALDDFWASERYQASCSAV